MKSFASVALFGAALVAAAPLNEKRDIVWHTTWTEVTETVMTTTTKWVAPGSEVSAAAANPGGDFHETAVHYSKPAGFSFHSYGKPTYETPAPPAPTTTTTEAAPVPTTTSTEAPPPASPTTVPTTTSTPPPPSPPAPTTPTETYVAPTTTSTYVAPTPTTTYIAPTTTSTYVAPTPTSIYTPPAAPTTSTTATAAAATPSSYSSGSGSSSSSGGASYSNVDLTYYTPGMGSCGIVSTETEAVVAVAANTMTKTYSGNPNNNPMCGKTISITANGVTKTATIVDTCPGCLGPTDLDLSPSLFSEFADESVGRITGASWTLN